MFREHPREEPPPPPDNGPTNEDTQPPSSLSDPLSAAQSHSDATVLPNAAAPMPNAESTASSDAAAPLPPPPRRHPPHIHPPITVPFISPLVLRKEVESVLEKEGDRALTGKNLSPFSNVEEIMIY